MIKTYIVDSFTDQPFKGNPAGVCIPEVPLKKQFMQNIAHELGLSETAFITKTEDPKVYFIRYFSPKTEIPLCGHATLASSKILFETTGLLTVTFITRQKIHLNTKQLNDLIQMEFPVYDTIPAQAPAELLLALGLSEIENCAYNKETNILLLEIESTRLLAHLNPDFNALVLSHNTINGVLITAPSIDDTYDFHSRYFWPWSGTNEDPVTGGTHTFLAKYWSSRLNKTKMRSFQSSKRSGWMELEIIPENKLLISGQAIKIFDGHLAIS